MNPEDRMKPVIVLPAGKMKKRDISELKANGFCVVEIDDPSLVRFMEPPPMGYSVQEQAAIKLCRVLLGRSIGVWTRDSISACLVDILIEGTPLETVKPAPLVEIPKVQKA